MKNDNILVLHFSPFFHMNNWISLNLIHKLKSIVAPFQCPHEIFTHWRNTCDFSHVGVHFHFLLLLPSSLVQCWVKSVLLRTVANTFELKCAHTQFWQYNEPTSTVKVTAFVLLVWPVHGPAQFQTQLTCFCRQYSKSLSEKRKEQASYFLFCSQFFASFLFALVSFYLVEPLISLKSSFLLFVLAVSVVFVSLPHTIVKQLPLWSRTSPRAEFISLSSVFVRTGLCLWLQCEAAL